MLTGSLGAAARKERATQLASQKAERVRVGLVNAAQRRADAAEVKAAKASERRLADADRRVLDANAAVDRLDQIAQDALADAQAARGEALAEPAGSRREAAVIAERREIQRISGGSKGEESEAEDRQAGAPRAGRDAADRALRRQLGGPLERRSSEGGA
eukprot:6372444-Prymnesium_polylepis.1